MISVITTGGEDMSKVAMLIEKSYQEAEALVPYYRLLEAGYEVDVVGSESGVMYPSKLGYPLKSDLSADEARAEDYIGLIIPGGGAPDIMRTKPGMVRLTRDMFSQGKVVAAICHGPQLLIEADVLRGKHCTCFKAVRTDVQNAGGLYEDSEVVSDGNLVTSRVPSDIPAFCREIIRMLEG